MNEESSSGRCGERHQHCSETFSFDTGIESSRNGVFIIDKNRQKWGIFFHGHQSPRIALQMAAKNWPIEKLEIDDFLPF